MSRGKSQGGPPCTEDAGHVAQFRLVSWAPQLVGSRPSRQPVGPKRSTRMRLSGNPSRASRLVTWSAKPADPQT